MNPENIPAKGVIHMVAGGPTDGDSGGAKRAHAQATSTIIEIDYTVPARVPVIHFGPTDAQGVHLPHNDALVISTTVANYTIQCIFVDLRNFADILFLQSIPTDGGLNPSITVHSLNLDPTFFPVKQKKRHFGPKKDKVIQEESSWSATWKCTSMTFNILRKYRMKLNPTKCACEVQSGRFLGYIVTEKGIEVNLDKIRAIQERKPPTNLYEVQKLAGSPFSRS
ncbi:UNVERIFIED_CONTAM: hypothetical protein Slati_2781500 [Sesamum latifolium]|uniref:Reverse transcriptase n=1 Tax=Sesamum latifolium TaxID=2727402 RepID=A0AAW2VY25_9LAMI